MPDIPGVAGDHGSKPQGIGLAEVDLKAPGIVVQEPIGEDIVTRVQEQKPRRTRPKEVIGDHYFER